MQLIYPTAMPQIQLPIFPKSCTAIDPDLAFEQRDGTVYYFNGHLPVFSHPVDDIASFASSPASSSPMAMLRRARSRAPSACRSSPSNDPAKNSVTRARRASFAAAAAQGHKLTGNGIARAQAMLDDGLSVPAIGAELGVLPNTLHKAISYGRLKKNSRGPAPSAPTPVPAAPTTQSARSVADGQAPMGVGTTRTMDRIAAAVGMFRRSRALLRTR